MKKQGGGLHAREVKKPMTCRDFEKVDKQTQKQLFDKARRKAKENAVKRSNT